MSQDLPFQEWSSNAPGMDIDTARNNDTQLLNKNNSESSKLLDLSSDSESEPEPLQLVPPKRKVRFRKRLRQGLRSKTMIPAGVRPSCCCWSCLHLVKGVALLMVAAILVVQIWFVLNVRSRVDGLYSFYRNNVDAENKNRLEELQKIRLNIRELKLNLTNTASELQEMSTALGLLTKEVTELKTTASNLQESIASAPQIKGLPNAVKDLKQNVANIGSQVSNLENRVQGLKEQHTTVQTLQKDMEQLKDSVQRVANLSSPEDHGVLRPLDDLKQNVLKSVSDTKELLEQRLDALETGVRTLNTTTDSVLESLERQQEQVEKLQNSSHSISAEVPAPEVLQKVLDKLVSGAVDSPNVTWAETIQECHHLAMLYHNLATRLHINGSANNQFEEITHRATQFVNETVQDVMTWHRKEALPVIHGTEVPRGSSIVTEVGSGSLPTSKSAVPEAARQRINGSS